MLGFSRGDDHTAYGWASQHPSEGHTRRAGLVSFGNFYHCIHDSEALLSVERYELARIREACPSGCRIVAAVLAAQESSGQRAPDQNADLVVFGKRLEFVLQFPADE